MNTNDVKQARFRLKNYIITETIVRLTGKTIGKDIQVGIAPKGKLNEKYKSFTLTLNVLVRDDKKNLNISLSIDGVFEYDTDSMQELLPFICHNAPAILFPYIRAYISNITALGGIAPIILPTLNLESVGKTLKDELEII
jgi:preprotein translocase subunit secB